MIPYPPAAERDNYSSPVTPANGVSEARQAKFITDLFKTAACETGGPKIIGVGNLSVQDDGGGPMPASGFIYAEASNTSTSPAEKTSYGTVQYVMNAAKAGTLTDCQS